MAPRAGIIKRFTDKIYCFSKLECLLLSVTSTLV